MYQENEFKKLYERLKAQYPQYQLEFLGDSLILKRLHSKVEVNRDGAKLYVNEKLYDQFTSEDVNDTDDLYELIEVFLLDLQHAGMQKGNETYIGATNQATKMGSRFLIGTAMCFTVMMIGLATAKSPWLILLVFLFPTISLLVLKQMQKKISNAAGYALLAASLCPWAEKVISVRWRMCLNALIVPMYLSNHRNLRLFQRNVR